MYPTQTPHYPPAHHDPHLTPHPPQLDVRAKDAKKTVKKLFEERYQTGKNRWFFTALRVRRIYHLFMSRTLTSIAVLSGARIGYLCVALRARSSLRFEYKREHAVVAATCFSP